ncbi:hypothetical protein ABG79_00819 [Caloramator mitchellensis]|uniref:Stage V sporulation protein AE n=1 Tax=Caloramator mitchellensis TaxID=908809 RepID=A0A0R3JV64_CALMK|nr:stage V sporulation protein AE [Caloramator mitchellensis]KRQ87481.1 hypothetical protein ABG79_00819 [Caloramator mitchellensis]
MKKRVILVTDGDLNAKKAIEIATQKIGGRVISRSAGNPTLLSGEEIIELIKETPYDPVVVMVDDRGNTHRGSGEEAMAQILKSNDVEVMGVVAVAANSSRVTGVEVDVSIDNQGNVIDYAVDKDGYAKDDKIIKGDTVDILNDYDVPVIVGVGDVGKMEGQDDVEFGAPIITKALEEVIKLYETKKKINK